MAIDGIWLDAIAESGGKERNPIISTRFSLSVENVQADAGWEG